MSYLIRGRTFVMHPTTQKAVSVSRKELMAKVAPKQYTKVDDVTERLRSAKTQSPTLEQLDTGLLSALQQRVQNTVQSAVDTYQRAFPFGHLAPEHAPENIARVKLANSFKPLTMEYHPGIAPHYDPKANKVSVMMPDDPSALGHELKHAHDHLSGFLDLTQDTHKLFSEVRAHAAQGLISKELTGDNPPNWEGRSALQMARSYEGKTQKGYRGTLESSEHAVLAWQKKGKY
ncbi:MAG: hypothetical protein H6981_02925 [Gammaproteobacteria bacterium]|nr:hypothetical protein [Gammaproteobacteria bacterium]MCP5135742.1 hypothetical protein [Gammaproteobacteria bacterium]